LDVVAVLREVNTNIMKLDFVKKKIFIFCDKMIARYFSASLILILCHLLATPFVFSQEVIVFKEFASNHLSQNSLRSVYSMRLQTWADGTAITVLILNPAGESHRKFCLEVLGLFPYQLQRVWDVLVFSGTGQSPIVMGSEQEMVEKIKSTPGAIGYLIDAEVPNDVKKLNIH